MMQGGDGTAAWEGLPEDELPDGATDLAHPAMIISINKTMIKGKVVLKMTWLFL
jgi:hypothetical protein